MEIPKIISSWIELKIILLVYLKIKTPASDQLKYRGNFLHKKSPAKILNFWGLVKNCTRNVDLEMNNK